MSATVVKSLTTFKKDDGKWYLKGNTHESNVYPHTNHKWEGKTGYDSREELEGEIIHYFHQGSLRGGSNYSLFMRELQAGLTHSKAFDSYLKIRDIHEALWHYYRDRMNTPEANAAIERNKRIVARLRVWEREVYARLGRDFRRWSPDKRRFRVMIGSCYVTRITERGYGYSYRYAYSHLDRDFPAVQAHEFASRMKDRGEIRIFEVNAA